ncbi:c-type cytochrome [Bordetella pertussis]|uniref:c-type cytochrome n=1 Tax=Bordetella pertussis TaxID=520 RepID=UPI002868B5E1|nr:c-type cytochrome [Bordetella pertussis]
MRFSTPPASACASRPSTARRRAAAIVAPTPGWAALPPRRPGWWSPPGRGVRPSRPSPGPNPACIRPRRSNAAGWWPPPATAWCATPRRAARPMPAGWRWTPRSAPSTPPTSRPTSRPASGNGRMRRSSAPCAKDADVRAMAHYLSSLSPAADSAGVEAAVQALERASEPGARLLPPNGERLFQGACAVCHETRHTAPQFGVRPSLALNTNLHSAHPDNLIQVILHGIVEPANGQLGYMPAFGDSLDAGQIAELVQYMRARFAPGEPAWQDVAQRVRELSRQE